MRKGPRPQQPDDSEASSTKEKGNPISTPATNGKGKRAANSAVNASSNANANASGANGTPNASSAIAGAAGSTNTDGNSKVLWSTIIISEDWGHRLTITAYIDTMVGIRRILFAQVSIRVRIKHTCRLQQRIQPNRSVSIEHRPHVTKYGP